MLDVFTTTKRKKAPVQAPMTIPAKSPASSSLALPLAPLRDLNVDDEDEGLECCWRAVDLKFSEKGNFNIYLK
jgi:hypothetical protein